MKQEQRSAMTEKCFFDLVRTLEKKTSFYAERLKNICVVLYYSGLRIGEIKNFSETNLKELLEEGSSEIKEPKTKGRRELV